MIETPNSGRVVVKQDYNSTVIEIPAKKNWPQILFMMVWLCGWAVGEYFALQTLLAGEGPWFGNAFILIWLTGWTIGGGFAIYTVLWQLFGREIVIVESGMLTLQRTVFGFGGKRKFETDLIKKVKTIAGHAVGIWKLEGKKVVGRSGGKIRFDFDKKVIRFGMGLTPTEAETVVDGLRQSGWIRSKSFTHDTERSY